MKGFLRTAFVVFAILVAVPLIALGCGKKKNEEGGADERESQHIVSFECTEFEDENGQLVPIGQVSVRALNVVAGATITTNGNTLTIGRANVTATPIANTAEYVFSFDSWDAPSTSVDADMTIKANFKREKAVYRIILDSNARTTSEELPTNLSVGYGEAFPTLPDVTAHGYSFMTDEYHFGWSIDKEVGAVEDNVEKDAVWGLDYYNHFQESNNYQKVIMSNADFVKNKYYVEDIDEHGNKKYILAKNYVHGKDYFISKHNDLIDWENHTITLYAQWRQNYITINLCKDVTAWSTRADGVVVGKEDGKTMINDVNMKIALYNGETPVKEMTSASGKAKFTGVDLLDENGDVIEYSVYAQRSQYDDELVDTGRKVKAYWNGQEIVDFNAYITYYSVTLEKNIASRFAEEGGLSGAGLYLPGESATISAVPALGYSFIRWEENETLASDANPYTFEVTAPVTYTAIVEPRED